MAAVRRSAGSLGEGRWPGWCHYPRGCAAAGARAHEAAATLTLALLLSALAGCSKEARPTGAGLPLTPPTGPGDPRIEQYQQNAWQVSQGSRYYTWYGCGGCHASGASGTGRGPDLGLGHWRHGDGFDAVCGFIARGHAGELARYGEKIPAEQLWQMTGYVRNLPKSDPQKRRREDLDSAGEPHDRQGPVPL